MKHLLVFLLGFTITASAQITSSDTATPVSTEKTYRSPEVDLKPQVKDGNYTLSMFISENFKFPPAIKNKKIIIFTSFIVETDGTMTDIKAFSINVKDLIKTDVVKIATQEEKINEVDQIETMKGEAVRVLKLYNKAWEPALKEGKPVRCMYNYPIHFNIE
jgi:protein TonB